MGRFSHRLFREKPNYQFRKINDPTVTFVGSVKEIGDVCTENGQKAEMVVRLGQSIEDREYVFVLRLIPTEQDFLSASITKIDIKNSKQTVSFSAGLIDSVDWYDFRGVQILITNEYRDKIKDKISEINNLLENDDDISVVYYSANGEEDNFVFTQSQRSAFCSVIYAFNELLTYYY